MLCGGHHCDRRELRYGSTASFNSSIARLVTASSDSRSANFLRAATSSALSLLVIQGTRVKRCRPREFGCGVRFVYMTAVVIIVIVVIAVAVVAGAVVVMRRRAAVEAEAGRRQAQEHRDQARAGHLEAERQESEADELTARAKREQLAAEQQRIEAAGKRVDADGLNARADAVDPDVPDDGS